MQTANILQFASSLSRCCGEWSWRHAASSRASTARLLTVRLSAPFFLLLTPVFFVTESAIAALDALTQDKAYEAQSRAAFMDKYKEKLMAAQLTKCAHFFPFRFA